MTGRPELDAENLKGPKPRKAKAAELKPEKTTPENWEMMVELAGEDPHDVAWFAAEAGGNMAERRASFLLRQAVAKKRLFLWPARKGKVPDRWATIPVPLTESG